MRNHICIPAPNNFVFSCFTQFVVSKVSNPLHTDLNPVCHLLALWGVHHILHVSRVRLKCGYLLAVMKKGHFYLLQIPGS